MPSIGRTMRDSLMELVRRGGGLAVSAGRLHHQESLQHVNAAAEGELARRPGRELDCRGLEGGQYHVDAEGLAPDTLGAVARLVGIKVQPDRRAGLHADR